MFRNETNYVLTNGVLLDGTEKMTQQTGRDIYIEGGRIGVVADAAERREGYEVVDLGGQYVLPGLINLHVHLPASGDFDTIIRDLAAQGKILSPRVVASNMAVSVPGGHMAGSLAYEAKTPEEAAAYVERIAAEKPDLIKLMITGGVLDAEVVGEPGVLRMQPALVKAACDKAHALGMKVAAHVESPEGVRVALENGVDSIEHGAQPDAAITALYKEKGAFQVATLSPALPYALFDRSVSHATYEQQENGKVVFDGIIAMARENLGSRSRRSRPALPYTAASPRDAQRRRQGRL